MRASEAELTAWAVVSTAATAVAAVETVAGAWEVEKVEAVAVD